MYLIIKEIIGNLKDINYRFGENWFYLSFDEIEFDFIIYVSYN
jgi:hypothetical protein